MSTPITLTGAYTCTHHNDKQRTECPVCLVATLRARAERAEDNLAALEQCHDDNCRGVVQIADELATAKERLRSEAMDDYAAIKDLQRELAAERARLDSGQILLTVAGERVWHCGVDLRAAIDAGMREGAK